MTEAHPAHSTGGASRVGGGDLLPLVSRIGFWTSGRLFGSDPEMGWEMAEKRLSWKADELLLRPLRRMANPCFYVVSDQKKHSQPFLAEDPGRWAQTTYVQRS